MIVVLRAEVRMRATPTLCIHLQDRLSFHVEANGNMTHDSLIQDLDGMRVVANFRSRNWLRLAAYHKCTAYPTNDRPCDLLSSINRVFDTNSTYLLIPSAIF
jgi:hypothetical protein